MNFLNKEEKMKHAFIKKFNTLNWKYSFDFDEEDKRTDTMKIIINIPYWMGYWRRHS